jgi:hypothetical protein
VPPPGTPKTPPLKRRKDGDTQADDTAAGSSETATAAQGDGACGWVGARVELCGLTEAASLNGRRGVCTDVEPSTHRLVVR